MQFNRKCKQGGFTLIEIMMVLLLIAILASIGIAKFTNFSSEARTNTLRANLKVLRNSISVQTAQMKLRCNVTTDTYPPLANLTANDITAGGTPCTTVQVANSGDRPFVQGSIPPNSWGAAQTNTITSCNATTSCTNRALECGTAGTARTAASDGWCYNPATGDIWANTNSSGSSEYDF